MSTRVEFAACLLMPQEDVKIFTDLWMDDLEMALRFRSRAKRCRGAWRSSVSEPSSLEAA